MYKYSFVKKESKHLFDDIKWVVNNSSHTIKCEPEKAKVVSIPDIKDLQVAMPIEVMPDVTVILLKTETCGNLRLNDLVTGFAIWDDVLYLRQRIYTELI